MKWREMINQLLNIDQMKHLRKLGVDTSKASMVLLFENIEGDYIGWGNIEYKDGNYFYRIDEIDMNEPVVPKLFNAARSDYDHSFREDCGVFTLQDILEIFEAINPKVKNLQYISLVYDCNKKYWVLYPTTIKTPVIANTSILEVAYSTLVWCLEQKII